MSLGVVLEEVHASGNGGGRVTEEDGTESKPSDDSILESHLQEFSPVVIVSSPERIVERVALFLGNKKSATSDDSGLKESGIGVAMSMSCFIELVETGPMIVVFLGI